MHTPETLNGYFEVVDDFLQKTFRDDCHLFLSMETRQYSAAVEKEPAVNLEGIDKTPIPSHQRAPAATASSANESREPTSDLLESLGYTKNPETTNFVAFSPRMLIRRDGTTLGKVKLLCGFQLPRVCRVEQGLMLNSEGVVTGTVKLKNVVDGLEVGGRAAVNMIAPASEDVTALDVQYRHKDFYYSTRYQRNGLGSSNLLVDSGTTFFNILAGAGFERQQISYLEQREARDQVDVLYAGVGFSGVDWSVAAKMARGSEAWTSARLALFQQLSPSTMVACAYNYDLSTASAHVSLGFTQGFRVRVPSLLEPSREELARVAAAGAAGASSVTGEGATGTFSRFLLACKAESTGLFSATLRGRFNGSIRWGLVAQKNMLSESSPVRFGLNIAMEKEQEQSV